MQEGIEFLLDEISDISRKTNEKFSLVLQLSFLQQFRELNRNLSNMELALQDNTL